MLRYKVAAGAFAAALIAAAPAFAADMPQPDFAKAPVAPAPVTFYNWTGVYAGVNAGYAWGDYDIEIPGLTSWSLDGDGFLVGGTLGANWQIDQFVFGVEGDWDWSDIEGSGPDPLGVPYAAETDWLATLRVRAGVAIDNVLIYGTGGAAFVKNEVADVVAAGAFSDDQNHVGWTVGAGVEVGVTENLSVKAEYLYVDAGEETYELDLPTNVDYTSHVVRAGVNYRFNLF